MNESTVNISDFHCRGMKIRSAHNGSRSFQRPKGLFVLETEPAFNDHGSESSYIANGSGGCTVFDIGLARAAQRARNRSILRPLPVTRRGKVLHFGSGEADSYLNSTIEITLAVPSDANSDGSLDFPPAA